MKKVVYVMCTNVGRSILKAHKLYHKNIIISKVFNLNLEKGSYKSNYDNYADLKFKENLPLKYINNINEKSVISEIKKIKPDIIIQSGWSQKFSNEILKIPKYGCIGEHPSPIPIGRGAASVNWAIIEGQKNWGDTFFIMNDEYDRGDIINQKFFKIKKFDNVKTIYDKIAILSHLTIKEKLSLWCNGKFDYLKINEKKATYYKRRKPEDGKINFRISAINNQKLIQAVTKPYPGAFVNLKNKKIIIWSSKIVKSSKIRIKNKNMKYIKKNVLIFNNEFFLKFSCGNYIKPIEIESSEIPLCNNKFFVNNFLIKKTKNKIL